MKDYKDFDYEFRDKYGNVEKKGSFHVGPSHESGSLLPVFGWLFIIGFLFNGLMDACTDGELWACIMVYALFGLGIVALVRKIVKKTRGEERK